MEFGLPVLPYMKNNIYTKLDFRMFVGMYHIVVVVIANYFKLLYGIEKCKVFISASF